ncbi:hypothetical protein [Cupriavidus sp. USMAHM13]|uniref:hypothetical protein n=1 Tax=Cupriavidus sp. USMAHM13 TaxID=1389192 RepID=UPI001E442BE8|nr:hypothetical protein [Cupriavidus sp. USMAHM13]
MSEGRYRCSGSDPIELARQKRESAQVRRLLVIDADHHFAGILSPGELATRLDEGTNCGHTLACISSPSAPAHPSTASFAMSARSTAPPAPCAWLQRLAIAVLRPCCAPGLRPGCTAARVRFLHGMR